MSQTYTLEFPTVAPQTFLGLKGELSKMATVLTRPDGTVYIHGAGIEAKASYDPSKNVLTVDILDRGICPLAMIQAQLSAALLMAARQ
jgi:hypothetical protein